MEQTHRIDLILEGVSQQWADPLRKVSYDEAVLPESLGMSRRYGFKDLVYGNGKGKIDHLFIP